MLYGYNKLNPVPSLLASPVGSAVFPHTQKNMCYTMLCLDSVTDFKAQKKYLPSII